MEGGESQAKALLKDEGGFCGIAAMVFQELGKAALPVHYLGHLAQYDRRSLSTTSGSLLYDLDRLQTLPHAGFPLWILRLDNIV